MANVGKHIKEMRIKQNMTQDELAAKLFVSRQTVSNYENGKSQPDIDMLLKIAEVLGTNVNVLIYGEPVTQERKQEGRKMAVQTIVTAVCLISLCLYRNWAHVCWTEYVPVPWFFWVYLFSPLTFGLLGWIGVSVLIFILKREPIHETWAIWIRWVSLCVCGCYLVNMLPLFIDWLLQCGASEQLPTWWEKSNLWLVMLVGRGGSLLFFIPGVFIGLSRRNKKKGNENSQP